LVVAVCIELRCSEFAGRGESQKTMEIILESFKGRINRAHIGFCFIDNLCVYSHGF